MMRIRTSWIPAALLAALAGGASHAAADGKSLYVAKCAMCHGNDGIAGKMGAGSRNFNDRAFKNAVTEAHVVTIIRDGKGKMTGLGARMTPDQAQAVAAYILTLAK